MSHYLALLGGHWDNILPSLFDHCVMLWAWQPYWRSCMEDEFFIPDFRLNDRACLPRDDLIACVIYVVYVWKATHAYKEIAWQNKSGTITHSLNSSHDGKIVATADPPPFKIRYLKHTKASLFSCSDELVKIKSSLWCYLTTYRSPSVSATIYVAVVSYTDFIALAPSRQTVCGRWRNWSHLIGWPTS